MKTRKKQRKEKRRIAPSALPFLFSYTPPWTSGPVSFDETVHMVLPGEKNLGWWCRQPTGDKESQKMNRTELQREILLKYLSDVVKAREQLQRVEKNTRRYLKEHKTLKAAYDAFVKNGGGTLDELEQWLASYRPLPSLTQKKHLKLVACNDRPECVTS
jgi:hypothetical protein